MAPVFAKGIQNEIFLNAGPFLDTYPALFAQATLDE